MLKDYTNKNFKKEQKKAIKEYLIKYLSSQASGFNKF